jgi:prepilin-type N-terminal cleavage/methylation domain-containing protein
MAAPLLSRSVPMLRLVRSQRGFSLTELMMTVAVAATVMAIGVPMVTDVSATIKLNEAARLIEREFQDARLKAVKTNRPLRVRTNCPGTGFIRTVEVLNTADDTAANRCLQTAFPFPADDNLVTRPNHDGPVRVIPGDATVTDATFQFQPDGTVFNVVSNVPTRIAAEQVVTVTRGSRSRTVRINGAGKIQLQ